MFKSYKDQSRVEWGTERNPTPSEIQTGALQRIADATELMAKRYESLIADRDWYKRRYEERGKENQKLRRSQAALRGYLGRLKAQ